MSRWTAGLLAWGVELICFTMVVASLVLLSLDRIEGSGPTCGGGRSLR